MPIVTLGITGFHEILGRVTRLKLGIWDFKAKSLRDSGLKVYVGGEMPIITLGISGFHEIFWLGITGFKNPSSLVEFS